MKEVLSEQDRVIIRIWTSRSNKEYPGTGVGHISVETQNPVGYMSLWPVPFTNQQIETYQQSGKLERKTLKFFSERDPHYMVTCQDDCQAEDGDPQIVICLYGLSGENMKARFEELKADVKAWRLVGANLLVSKLEEKAEGVASNLAGHSKVFESKAGKRSVQNCSSLAYELLKAGGIYDEVSSSFSYKFSSVVKPDDLGDLIIAAKKYELKKYGETENFRFIGETNIVKARGCVLM